MLFKIDCLVLMLWGGIFNFLIFLLFLDVDVMSEIYFNV